MVDGHVRSSATGPSDIRGPVNAVSLLRGLPQASFHPEKRKRRATRFTLYYLLTRAVN